MKKRLLSFLLAFSTITVSSYCNESLPEPYNSIIDLPFDGHGWFGNAQPLEACLLEKPAKVVIEVGSWLGSSTRFIAERVGEEGKVYAIDTWLGSPDEIVHMQDPRLPYLYQLFLSNVKHAGLTSIIIPVRMKSLEAAKGLNVMADLVYIDASHNEESVYKDIIAWNSHLEPSGIMCGDDWTWDSVRRGVIRAANQLNRKIYAVGNFWRMVE